MRSSSTDRPQPGGAGAWVRLALVGVLGAAALVAPAAGIGRTGAVYTDSATVGFTVFPSAPPTTPAPTTSPTAGPTATAAVTSPLTAAAMTAPSTGTVTPTPSATPTPEPSATADPTLQTTRHGRLKASGPGGQ